MRCEQGILPVNTSSLFLFAKNFFQKDLGPVALLKEKQNEEKKKPFLSKQIFRLHIYVYICIYPCSFFQSILSKQFVMFFSTVLRASKQHAGKTEHLPLHLFNGAAFSAFSLLRAAFHQVLSLQECKRLDFYRS